MCNITLDRYSVICAENPILIFWKNDTTKIWKGHGSACYPNWKGEMLSQK